MFSIFTILIEFVLLAALQAVGITERFDGYMLPLISVFSIAYMIDLANSKRSSMIRVSLLGGYFFRLALLMLDIFGRNIYTLPNSGADSEMFYNTSVLIAQGQSWEDMDISAFAGMIFREIGVSRLYMQFIFLCFSLVALLAVNKMLEILKLEERHRNIAMAILCFLPNYAILSVLFLRESLIAMMIAISLLWFVKWLVGRSEWYFWLSLLPVLFAAMFHGGVMGILVGYCVVRFLYSRKRRKFSFSILSIVSAVVIAFLAIYLFNNYADVFFGKMQNMEEISDVGSTFDRGGSSYARYVGDSSTVINMLIYSPIRIIMFQFSPFVWQIRGLSDIIAICFNALFYMYIWFKAIKDISSRKTEHRTIVIALLIVWFATTFVFAWGVTNVGTAIRHRDKMVAIAGVLFGLTMKQEKELEKGVQKWKG